MALRKASDPSGLRQIEPRDYPRDLDGMLEQLRATDVSVRRWAARDLSQFPQAAAALCRHLLSEPDASVREAVFTTLSCLASEQVVDGVLPLLRSEDATLRNGAIEVLCGLPDAVGPRIDALLKDPDPDVRIFTVNLLGELHHPDVPRWLSTVMLQDAHVNVVGAALDVLAEVGAPSALPALKQVRARFGDDPFIAFAADVAEQRIEGA